MFSLFTAVLVPCQATVECLFPWTVDCRITGSDMCMHIICLNTKLSFIMQKSTSQTTPKHRNFSSHSVFPSALLSLGPLTHSPGSLFFCVGRYAASVHAADPGGLMWSLSARCRIRASALETLHILSFALGMST